MSTPFILTLEHWDSGHRVTVKPDGRCIMSFAGTADEPVLELPRAQCTFDSIAAARADARTLLTLLDKAKRLLGAS